MFELIFYIIPILIGLWFGLPYGWKWIVAGIAFPWFLSWPGLILMMILLGAFAIGKDPNAPTPEEKWKAQFSPLNQNRIDTIPDGWHPDPAGRYMWRYHDGRNWTMWVSDGASQTAQLDQG